MPGCIAGDCVDCGRPWGVGHVCSTVTHEVQGTLQVAIERIGFELFGFGQRYDRMTSMLRRLEWLEGDHGEACPVCHSIAYGFPKRGDKVHDPACDLAGLLKDLP